MTYPPQMPPSAPPPAPPPDERPAYNTPAPKSSGMAMASLVLGILSIPLMCVGVGILTAITGLILGILSLSAINKDPMRVGGKGLAIAGISTSGGSFLLVPLLIVILLPSLGKSRELANRATCAANMRGIVAGMNVYGAGNNDQYPAVRPGTFLSYGPLSAGPVNLVDGNIDKTITKQEYDGKDNAGSVNACVFLMCAAGDLSPKLFVCRSDPGGPAPSMTAPNGAQVFLNFDKSQNSSYSFAYPWNSATTTGGWWRATANASLPVGADVAPQVGTGTPASTPQSGASGAKGWNSANHGGDGQNVVFGDNHAEFVRSPTVGQNNDNIWTSNGRGGASPAGMAVPGGSIAPGYSGGMDGNYDVVMVPVADRGTGARN